MVRALLTESSGCGIEEAWKGRSRSRTVATIAAVLGVLGLTAPAARAAHTPPSLYHCVPRPANIASPPPAPVLPPDVAARMAKAIESDEFEQVCPTGEVPMPTGAAQGPKRLPPAHGANSSQSASVSRSSGAGRRGGHRHRRPPLAAASREPIGGYWYSWSQGWQEYSGKKGVNGLWVSQTNEDPYIPLSESQLSSHSSAQLWAINRGGGGCFSTAETGWSESYGQFGDVNPHLFVYAIDCGAGLGYANYPGSGGLPWVQSSSVVFPNSVLTHNDAFHVYGARMDGNNWWIYYDGQWVGYIPHSAWTYRFPGVITEAQAGGEVMTVNYSTCADMGYAGLYGGNPGAAMFGQVWVEFNYNTQSALTDLLSYSNDPSYYATGNWSSGTNHGYAFRYGGPGWC